MKHVHFLDTVAILITTVFLLTINGINKQKIWTLEEISYQSSLSNIDRVDYLLHRTVVSNENRCLSIGYEATEPTIVRLLISAQEVND